MTNIQLVPPVTFSYRKDLFSQGTYTYVSPNYPSWIKVTAAGGGGSGAPCFSTITPANNFVGGGGGAGGFFQGIFKTKPSCTYNFIVGGGGVYDNNGSVGVAGGNTIFKEAQGTTIGIAYGGGGGLSSTGGVYNGGLVDCDQAYIKINGGGGSGIYPSNNQHPYKGTIQNNILTTTTLCNYSIPGGGGGGIGGSGSPYPAGPVYIGGSPCINVGNNLSSCAAGSGGGAFGGLPGWSIADGNSTASGGGGGISRHGGNAFLSLVDTSYTLLGGGGAGIFSNGIYTNGGIGIDTTLTPVNTNAVSNKGKGGGGGSGARGYLQSGYQFSYNTPIADLPSHLQMFYYIFGNVFGSAGGSHVNGTNTGAIGQDSALGGGGAVSTRVYPTSNIGYRGGHSLVCGGGGGACGVCVTGQAYDNLSIGGNGAGGGGGGGGAIPGRGGDGFMIYEVLI